MEKRHCGSLCCCHSSHRTGTAGICGRHFQPCSYPEVVALGDDCLAEVSGSESAVSYMADYLGGNVVNYAAVGTTSGKLVSDLQSNQNMKRDVQTADVVMISVGVNDFIEEVL